MMALTPRALAAEALGTLLLVATVVGSGIMAERLAGGNDAVALLANTLATGAILYVLITALGPISGAHINPAVSTVFALGRNLGPAAALAYVAVQIAGGIAGTLLAHAMFAEPLIQFSTHPRTGGGQWLSEAVATFALVFTILMTLRTRPEAVPMAVALVITAGYWFTASTSFANPAVTVARALTDSFSGIAPADVLPFIAAQFAGALIGWLAARWLAPPRTASPDQSA
jgi:glycerol uptake facilitator-like aquaporin